MTPQFSPDRFGRLMLLVIFSLLPGLASASMPTVVTQSHARPEIAGFPLPSEGACIGPACLNLSTRADRSPVLASLATAPRCNGTMRVHDDIDGDCHSDLLWYYYLKPGYAGTVAKKFAYWRMNGATRVGSAVFSLPLSYAPGTSGDFNGDGKTDLVWLDDHDDLGAVHLWLNQGDSFSDQQIGTAPNGWKLVGAGDVNGDGHDDLVWINPGTCQLGFWYMNGATRVGSRTISVTCGYRIDAVVVRPSNGVVDLVWSGYNSAGLDQFEYLWKNDGGGHFQSTFAGERPQQYAPMASGSAGDEPALLLQCSDYGYPCAGCAGSGCFNSPASPGTAGLSLWQMAATGGQFSTQGYAYFDDNYFVGAAGNYWNSASGTEIDAVWEGLYTVDGTCTLGWPECPYRAYLWRIPTGAGGVQAYSLGVIPAHWQLLP